MKYRHRQSAPLCWPFYLAGVGVLVSSWFLPELRLTIAASCAGLLLLLLAGCFQHLTVADEGDALSIRFGPLPCPLFRRRVRYDEIRDVQVGRTTILDGWGIHYSLSGGWVWNIWGRDCVVLRFSRGLLKIGTDDAENLAAYLQAKIKTAAE